MVLLLLEICFVKLQLIFLIITEFQKAKNKEKKFFLFIFLVFIKKVKKKFAKKLFFNIITSLFNICRGSSVVEQGPEKPCVGGSIPPLGTIS
jgi:hypothetical protein